MSTIELRERLIEKIQNIDDESILEEALRLFSIESDNIEIYRFSEDQKSEINKYKLQIKHGQSFTNEEVNKEIDEWLNK